MSLSKKLAIICIITLVASYLFISRDQMPEENPYENITPEMLSAVKQTNEEILQEKAGILPAAMLGSSMKLQSVRAISDVCIGDTVFYDALPAGTPAQTESKTIYFSISAEEAMRITKISDITKGFEKFSTAPQYSGPELDKKLSNGLSANYIYVVGVSRYQVYEYMYELHNFFGITTSTEIVRAAVPAGDSAYKLLVNEGAVKVHIETAADGDTILTWDSQNAYKEALSDASVTADKRADRCIFF